MRRAARHLVDAGLAPIVVVISDDERYADALAGLPLRLVTNPALELGIGGSIGIGLIVLAGAALVLLGASGWLGGKLAYRYGVRVVDEATQAEGFR